MQFDNTLYARDIIMFNSYKDNFNSYLFTEVSRYVRYTHQEPGQSNFHF